jgi:hypothetical protein
MIEVLASSYELFCGDFLFFGLVGGIAAVIAKSKENEFDNK